MLRLCGSVRADEKDSIVPITALPEESTDLWPFAKAMAGHIALVRDLDRHITIPGGPWGESVHEALALPIPSSNVTAPLGVRLLYATACLA